MALVRVMNRIPCVVWCRVERFSLEAALSGEE